MTWTLGPNSTDCDTSGHLVLILIPQEAKFSAYQSLNPVSNCGKPKDSVRQVAELGLDHKWQLFPREANTPDARVHRHAFKLITWTKIFCSFSNIPETRIYGRLSERPKSSIFIVALKRLNSTIRSRHGAIWNMQVQKGPYSSIW